MLEFIVGTMIFVIIVTVCLGVFSKKIAAKSKGGQYLRSALKGNMALMAVSFWLRHFSCSPARRSIRTLPIQAQRRDADRNKAILLRKAWRILPPPFQLVLQQSVLVLPLLLRGLQHWEPSARIQNFLVKR